MAEALYAVVASIPVVSLAQVLGARLGLLDRPGGIKPHVRPVPYTGGAALLIVIVSASVLSGVPIFVPVASMFAWAIGFLDDRLHLAPRLKLSLLAAPVVVVVVGMQLPVAVAVVAAAFGMVLINAFNVIDGLDGLAGGVALLASLPLLFAGGSLHAVVAALIGAVIGFLVFNLHPARIFLGDEGSLLLGLLLWLTPLSLIAESPTLARLGFALLLWAFPIANAVFVVVRRLREGRSPLVGDRGHLYDVLHTRFGLRTTLIICWGFTALFATLAAAFGA